MYASHWKKIKKIPCGTSEIFAFIRFGSHWRARINLNYFGGYNINFLSIWPFMCHPCFPPNMSQKWHFSIFFQWLAYIKYECYLQELEMACVFAIKISIYIVCYLWFKGVDWLIIGPWQETNCKGGCEWSIAVISMAVAVAACWAASADWGCCWQ